MAMGWRIKLIDGEEHDVVTRWRHLLCYLEKPGKTKKVKKRIRKRFRRIQKERIRQIMLTDKHDIYLGIY